MRAQRLRVTFSRGDVLRYITHLDLMRAWERALKRAGLPLAYSEGFTRHAQIALAAPLPVGATAEGEMMDIFLEASVPSAEFRERLAAQTPPGLSVQRVEEIALSVPSLQSLVREWTWRAVFPASTDRAALGRAVADLLALGSLRWELRREKEVKRYDLRALIYDLSLDPDTADTATASPSLSMRLKAEAGGRPEQVARALGYDPQQVLIHRTSLILASLDHAPIASDPPPQEASACA